MIHVHRATIQQRPWKIAVAVLVLVLPVIGAATIAPLPVGAQAAEAAVTVTPSTDLLDGQTVQVSGTGFLPNSGVFIVSCEAGATSGTQCDLGGLPSAPTDENGAFSTSFAVRRYIQGFSRQIDCAVDSCVIGVGDGAETRTANAPVGFRNVLIPQGTLTVTPATALIEGQIVQVSGSGFAPNRIFLIRQCGSAEIKIRDCRSNRYGDGSPSVQSDNNGDFTATYQVTRDVLGGSLSNPTLLDCAVETCRIGAGDTSDDRRNSFAAISLADVPHPVPTFTVTPNGDAFGSAALAGTGFPPLSSLHTVFCGPNIPADCVQIIGSAFTDSAGSIVGASNAATARVNPPQGYSGGAFDCLVDTCTVLIQEGEIGAIFAGRGVTIAQSAPVVFPVPQLTVSVKPYGTLKAGTNNAVVEAEVNCDYSTPVVLEGTISQAGISGSFQPENLYCTGGDPLQLFIPARNLTGQSSNFALGDATVSVSMTPYKSFAAGPVTNATATTQLIDFDSVKQVIDAALADPANADLLQAIIRAIQSRVAQDPVFRQEFFAAIHGT